MTRKLLIWGASHKNTASVPHIENAGDDVSIVGPEI